MSKTQVEKFCELDLKIRTLVDAANELVRKATRGPSGTPTQLYYLKTNERTRRRMLDLAYNADRAEMVGECLFPNASKEVQ
jgi:hypothetical protein